MSEVENNGDTPSEPPKRGLGRRFLIAFLNTVLANVIFFGILYCVFYLLGKLMPAQQ